MTGRHYIPVAIVLVRLSRRWLCITMYHISRYSYPTQYLYIYKKNKKKWVTFESITEWQQWCIRSIKVDILFQTSLKFTPSSLIIHEHRSWNILSNQIMFCIFTDRFKRISKVIRDMYGTDLMNAKRVLTTKMSKSQPNPENLSLAERILINRRKGPGVSGFFLTCS